MKNHFISACYQLRTNSSYTTANAFAEALKQSKKPSFLLYSLESFQTRQKFTHMFPLNLPLVLNQYILEFKFIES